MAAQGKTVETLKMNGGSPLVIDFHTHVFPDPIAARTITFLTESIDNLYTPVSGGTVTGLLANMNDWQIDVSVTLPIVTKPSQFVTINQWAQSIASDRIVSFGGIFPYTDDYKRDIDFVVNLGLKGLKFHAEYQNFVIDAEPMLTLYDYALSKGLILVHHAGFDPAFPAPFKSSPQKFMNIANAMRGGVIVAAHLGGHAQWDDVETILAGSGIYLDTSMGFSYFSQEQFLRIVKKHGSDKILFASDAPWSHAQKEIETIRSLPLPEEDRNAILGGNAKRILGL